MLVQIAEALFQSFHIGFLDAVQTDAAMHLQSLCGSNDYRQLGL